MQIYRQQTGLREEVSEGEGTELSEGEFWDLALRTQSSRRTYRTGQEYDCSYWDLTGNVGLEGLIDKCIHNKVSMVEYFKTKGKQAIEEL